MLTRNQKLVQSIEMINELAANKNFDILIQIRKNLTASLPVAELIPEDQKVCERIDELLNKKNNMEKSILNQEKELEKMASIGTAGKAILNAAKLNNVSIDDVMQVCIGMAKHYEKNEILKK